MPCRNGTGSFVLLGPLHSVQVLFYHFRKSPYNVLIPSTPLPLPLFLLYMRTHSCSMKNLARSKPRLWATPDRIRSVDDAVRQWTTLHLTAKTEVQYTPARKSDS
jgi:hypothetical protein